MDMKDFFQFALSGFIVGLIFGYGLVGFYAESTSLEIKEKAISYVKSNCKDENINPEILVEGFFNLSEFENGRLQKS